MATNPKMQPCPRCGSADHLAVYSYETSHARHVECDKCFYLGPGEGSIRAAIKAHNERALAKAKAADVAAEEQVRRPSSAGANT
jgi:Zn ribbon nucleic-acid-binding protein